MDSTFILRNKVGAAGLNLCKDVASATNYFLSTSSAELQEVLNSIISGEWLDVKDGKVKAYGLDMTSIGAYISYQGFDPRMLAIKLDGMRKYEDQRKFDIALMVAISIERGNRVTKMHLASTPTFQKAISELIATYDLKDKAGKDPGAITLSRVAAAFPHIACAYMNIALNPTITIADLGHVSKQYPKPMMCPHFTALIPKDHNITRTLLRAHSVFNYYFTLKISDKKLKQPKMSVIVNNVWKYINIVLNGSYLDQESQLTYLESFSIISRDTNGDVRVCDPAIAAAKYWVDHFEKYLPEEEDDQESEGDELAVTSRSRKGSASSTGKPEDTVKPKTIS